MRSLRVAAVALLLAGCASPVAGRGEAVVGGAPDDGDEAVVAVVSRRVSCGGAPDGVSCSGTLVAPRVVLTAAHCVDRARRVPGGSLEVFFGAEVGGDGDFVVVQAVAVDERYDATTREHDLALLLLAEEAPTPPHPLPTGTVDDLAAGASLRVVGFGVTAARAADSGRKRSGAMRLGEVRPLSFDAEPDPANSCTGDSGGPVFADLEGEEALLGVTASGDASCVATAFQVRVDTSLDVIEPFVAMAGGAPLGWPAGAQTLAEVGTVPCASDADCPAAMACVAGLDGGAVCTLSGLGAGTFGDACAGDDDCGRRESCARVWPDGEDACRCFESALAVPDDPSGGCAVSAGAPGRALLAWVLGVVLAAAVVARRRPQRKR